MNLILSFLHVLEVWKTGQGSFSSFIIWSNFIISTKLIAFWTAFLLNLSWYSAGTKVSFHIYSAWFSLKIAVGFFIWSDCSNCLLTAILALHRMQVDFSNSIRLGFAWFLPYMVAFFILGTLKRWWCLWKHVSFLFLINHTDLNLVLL